MRKFKSIAEFFNEDILGNIKKLVNMEVEYLDFENMLFTAYLEGEKNMKQYIDYSNEPHDTQGAKQDFLRNEVIKSMLSKWKPNTKK